MLNAQTPYGADSPAPEPAHSRDTPGESAVQAWSVRELEADLRRLREENTRLKELLGPGPAVLIGVDSLPALLKHLEGGDLDLSVRTWQFPPHAVAYLLEAALDVARDPANGLCADSVPEREE